MTKLERKVVAMAADSADHTDWVFLARSELSQAVAGSRNALSESRELIADADAMLDKGGKGLIECYYRAAKGGL